MNNVELLQCLHRLKKRDSSLSCVNITFLGGNIDSSNHHAIFIKKVQHNVTSIYLSNNRVGGIGVRAILIVLARNKSVQKLSLSYVPQGREEEFYTASIQNSLLQCLEINGIDTEGIVALTSSLKTTRTLKKVSLTLLPSQMYNEDAFNSFLEVLGCHSSVKEFHINGSGANETAMLNALSSSLEMPNTTTTSIRLQACIATPESGIRLASALRHNRTLSRLEIHQSAVCKQLFLALQFNTTIKVLVIKDCHLGRNKELIESISSMIEKNTSIVELNLDQNWIGTESTIELAKGLKKNTSVEKFFFRGNFSLVGGVDALANALKDNSTIQTIDIGNMWESQVHYSRGTAPLGFVELLYRSELNRAGRNKIREPNFPLEDFIDLISKIADDTYLVYGLIREIPHQWSRH